MTAADVTFSADMQWLGVPDDETASEDPVDPVEPVVEMPTIVF